MKLLLVVLLLIIGGVGYLLFGPSDDKTVQDKEKASSSKTSGTQARSDDGTSASSSEMAENSQADSAESDAPIRRMPAATSIMGELSAAGSYATGYTQHRIKVDSRKKINRLNDKHNEKLNKLLE